MMRLRLAIACASLWLASNAVAQSVIQHDMPAASPAPADAPRHVPPDPPSAPMAPMSSAQMVETMQMDDAAAYGAFEADQLEWRDADGDFGWDVQGWYGGDYNKIRLRSEGEARSGSVDDASAEALWDHVVARWWNSLAGVRHDFGEGPERTWLAIGIEGLAPQWFDVAATLYLGDSGRTAARAHVRYEWLLTQRLVLQPQVELNLYGEQDAARGLGSGLSDFEAGLRLRYEVRRELAPYIGVEWRRLFGGTADFARAAGDDASTVQFVAGLRLRF